jgi:hypothetical protein
VSVAHHGGLPKGQYEPLTGREIDRRVHDVRLVADSVFGA